MPRNRSSPYSGRYSKSGVYTSSGIPVRNPAAYAATGARTYTEGGRPITDPVAYSGAIEASVRQNTDRPKYLYHYTDSDSAGKIANSGRLKASTGPGDCALGQGVYMTAKPPKSSTSALLSNNYDGAAQSYGKDKVQSYVRVDADRVGAISGRRKLGRDVFVVPGDLDLEGTGEPNSSRCMIESSIGRGKVRAQVTANIELTILSSIHQCSSHRQTSGPGGTDREYLVNIEHLALL